MSQVSLRENNVIVTGVTLLCSIFLIALSIEVGYESWKQVVDIQICLALFNLTSCLYVVIVNKPTIVFYLREIIVCSFTAVISFYIWISVTLSENSLIFMICLAVVLASYLAIFYAYKKPRSSEGNEKSGTTTRVVGVAGALGAASQILTSDSGVLLLISTFTSIGFSLMAIVYLRLAIKRRWGKASGAWNEI